MVENNKTDLKEDFVYQNEYNKAAKMAENDDTPINVAPIAPSLPRMTA